MPMKTRVPPQQHPWPCQLRPPCQLPPLCQLPPPCHCPPPPILPPPPRIPPPPPMPVARDAAYPGAVAARIRTRTATTARARCLMFTLRTTATTLSLPSAGWAPRDGRVDRRVLETVLKLHDPLGAIVRERQVPDLAPALQSVGTLRRRARRAPDPRAPSPPLCPGCSLPSFRHLARLA